MVQSNPGAARQGSVALHSLGAPGKAKGGREGGTGPFAAAPNTHRRSQFHFPNPGPQLLSRQCSWPSDESGGSSSVGTLLREDSFWCPVIPLLIHVSGGEGSKSPVNLLKIFTLRHVDRAAIIKNSKDQSSKDPAESTHEVQHTGQ